MSQFSSKNSMDKKFVDDYSASIKITEYTMKMTNGRCLKIKYRYEIGHLIVMY